MISFAEINKTAAYFDVPADTVEKDYVIAWVLSCLAKSILMQNFIFYGGTAIKRIYFADHRFSEDIDLISCKKYNKDQIVHALNTLEYARHQANLELQIDPTSIEVSSDKIQLSITYNGFEEIVGAPKIIQLDFSMHNELYGETVVQPIIASYSDLNNQTTLPVMTLNTILANKLGLIMDLTRNEPRDIYDVWFLLQRTNLFDFNFKKICQIHKEKYSYSPSKNNLLSRLNQPGFRKLWDIRLSHQLSSPPPIDRVIADITAQLNLLFVSQ